MAKRRKIIIFDTTLRDGEQSPGASLNIREKLQIAKQLDRLRVDVIEAGFPIASVGDFEAVKAVASEVRRPIIAGLEILGSYRAWSKGRLFSLRGRGLTSRRTCCERVVA